MVMRATKAEGAALERIGAETARSKSMPVSPESELGQAIISEMRLAARRAVDRKRLGVENEPGLQDDPGGRGVAQHWNERLVVPLGNVVHAGGIVRGYTASRCGAANRDGRLVNKSRVVTCKQCLRLLEADQC